MSVSSPCLLAKIAVVVGGTSGIGRAISLGLADAGAAVIASGRNKDKVDAVAAELESKHSRTLRVTCDIASRPSLKICFSRCCSALAQLTSSLTAPQKFAARRH